MLLSILVVYIVGALSIGVPMLGIFYEQNLPLSNKMAFATIIFYPIVVVALLIYGTIIAIKGLLDFIKLLFKGGLF